MIQISRETEASIMATIVQDLEPSLVSSVGKAGVALTLGGGLSLYLCGQFGLGLSAAASSLSHTVHHSLGAVWCAALCGALFSLVPVILLRLMTRPLEFRALIRKRPQPQIMWILCIGTLLSYHGDFGFEFLSVGVWSLAAYGLFRGLGELLGRLPPSGLGAARGT